MHHVHPLVGNVLMEPGHLKPRFLSAVAPLCFSGELPLELCEFLLALGKVLVVRIFHPVGGNGKGFKAHVHADHRTSGRQRVNLYIRAAQGNKVLAAWVLADCGGQDAALDLFADLASYDSQLGELDRSIQHLNVCTYTLALVALTVVMLALEPGITRLPALFNPPEEVLVGEIQVLKRANPLEMRPISYT